MQDEHNKLDEIIKQLQDIQEQLKRIADTEEEKNRNSKVSNKTAIINVIIGSIGALLTLLALLNNL